MVEHAAAVNEKYDRPPTIILAVNRERGRERQCGEKTKHGVLIVG
jgi:hypothetical protein